MASGVARIEIASRRWSASKMRLRGGLGRCGGRRGRRGRGMGRDDHRLNNRRDPAFGQNQRAQ
jgi:hypothetical protein